MVMVVVGGSGGELESHSAYQVSCSHLRLKEGSIPSVRSQNFIVRIVDILNLMTIYPDLIVN